MIERCAAGGIHLMRFSTCEKVSWAA